MQVRATRPKDPSPTFISTFETPTSRACASARDLLLSFLLPRIRVVTSSRIFISLTSHDEGKKQPSDTNLAECLTEMPVRPDQCPVYLIIDALEKSSNTSEISSSRERFLELVKNSSPHLRLCVTSHPEIDIRGVLAPLTSPRVSPHDQRGQKERYRRICQVSGLLEFGTNCDEMGG